VADLEDVTLVTRVVRAERLAADVRLFELRDPLGRELPAFTAGSHIKVRAPNGAVRKYSLCNSPSERNRYLIAVKRDPDGRGGSVSMVDDVRVDDELAIGAPDNAFALDMRAPGYVFIAGSIGITPILAMIRALEADGIGTWRLYYLGRTRETTPFVDELAAQYPAARVRVHFDDGDPAKAFDLWPILEKPSKAHVYCCGPRSLMDAVRDMTGHWNPGTIHFESFVDGAAMARPDDHPFVVQLARSGTAIPVPAGTTILEALRAAGHRVPSSCESGTCGSCRTVLLEGEALHRDLVLMPDEQASNIMVCVSRARSERLVLDL